MCVREICVTPIHLKYTHAHTTPTQTRTCEKRYACIDVLNFASSLYKMHDEIENAYYMLWCINNRAAVFALLYIKYISCNFRI